MSFLNCFKGKSILITGAGQGIGRALSQRLHEYGSKVYAVTRSKGPLDSLVEKCPNIVPIQLDVGASWEETRKVVDGMKDLDVVINNAAMQVPMTTFLEVTEKIYDNYSDVNLKSVFNISQVAAKNMIAANKKGTIINISSIWLNYCISYLSYVTLEFIAFAGVYGEFQYFVQIEYALRAVEQYTMYCTLKAAMDMLTKCMALELGPNSIRVNSVNLGFVRTPIYDSTYAGVSNDEEKLKELLKPFLDKTVYGQDFLPMEDVVNTILFTASDLARTLTGSCIVLDGGYTTS